LEKNTKKNKSRKVDDATQLAVALSSEMKFVDYLPYLLHKFMFEYLYILFVSSY